MNNIAPSIIDVCSQIKTVWIHLCVNHKRLILGACYRPPSANNFFCKDLHDSLNKVITRFPTSPILMGDFNFPTIVWSGISPVLQPFSLESNNFVDLCSDYSLSQLVTKPTRTTSSSANILDLILTTCPKLVSSILHLPGLSDHCL